MEAIFHEEQEGSLCAQHCLNALLQAQYFSAVDLADIARQLDESERLQMAEAGTQSIEYQRFIQQASSNFDDSGFFSIQVIDKALQVWGLNLVQYNSQDPIAREARQSPVAQNAYICNFRDHWFCIRKIGKQWFNLNSLLTGPELISDTYLSLFLTQLQQEGYSIFIVTGRLPECEADDVLNLAPAVQLIKPRLINENQSISKSDTQTDDPELQRALMESRCEEEKDDKMLQRALQMSLEGYVIEDSNDPGPSQQTVESKSTELTPPTQEELRLKRQAFLQRLDQTARGTSDSETTDQRENQPEDKIQPQESEKSPEKKQKECEGEVTEAGEVTESGEVTEDEMLKQAIAMSMEGQG
ncbi:ataxin-3-like [Ostrea edulis]|uniref:ataxin-3-like n=1 Tax=Ostrea edulis TaxID=37623 RepID=UPI002094AD73|nr:ataxin-3-like [Ostrea edulis]